MKMYAILAVVLIIMGGLTVWTTTQGNVGYVINENHYENGEISLNYFKDWDIINVNHDVGEIVGFQHSIEHATNLDSTIYVTKISSSSGTNLEDAYAEAVRQASQIASYKEISNRTLTVDGAKAYEFVYNANNQGYPAKWIGIIVEKNGKIYELLYIGNPDLFDREKADFYEIVNSFKIK